MIVDPVGGQFIRHQNGIMNGLGIGAAVADNGGAVQPKQRRAAILGIIDSFFEITKGLWASM